MNGSEQQSNGLKADAPSPAASRGTSASEEVAVGNTRTISDSDSAVSSLKPLSPLPAFGIFLALGFFFRVCIYGGIPFLEDRGLHPVDAFFISFTLPSMALFALAFIMVKREGNPMTRESLSARFRLRRFGWRPILLIVGIFIVGLILTQLMSPTQSWIVDLSSWFRPGEAFPPLQDPTVSADSLTDPSVAWMGPSAAGNWRWVIMILVAFFFNIFGEELLWRGVLWPRQELVHGTHTWLIHGVMWYVFHLPFYPWALITLLPHTLLLSFLIQRTRNTWLSIILHTLQNAIFYTILLMITLGFID